MIGSIEGWNCRFEPAWFHLEILDRHRGERICARRRSRVYRGEKKVLHEEFVAESDIYRRRSRCLVPFMFYQGGI